MRLDLCAQVDKQQLWDGLTAAIVEEECGYPNRRCRKLQENKHNHAGLSVALEETNCGVRFLF